MRETSVGFAYESMAQEVIIGSGAISRLDSLVDVVREGSVGVIASRRAWESPLGEAVSERIGQVKYSIWNEVPVHTPMILVKEAAQEWSDRDVRLIIAIGGGSTSDFAKAVAMTLATGGNLDRYFSLRSADGKVVDHVLAAPLVPIVAIPTTLSGAEVTPGAGVTDLGIKHVLWDRGLIARTVLYETSGINQIPDDVIRTTGMNGVAHCVEAAYSSNGNDMGDVFAEQGLDLLIEGMLRTIVLGQHDPRANYALFAGAFMASRALSTARVCLHHAICHVLGARFEVGHGDVNAVMISHVVDFNLESSVEAQGALLAVVQRACARVLDVALVSTTLGDALREVERMIGAPTTLPEIGLATIDAGGVWEALSHERGLVFNPRVVGRSDVNHLLEQAGGTLRTVPEA
jgi:alcohol dehydrogenase